MMARIEHEERAKFAAQNGMEPAPETFEEPTEPCTGSPDNAPDVPLLVIAKRFAFLGTIAFGGPPAHVALMQCQTWRSDLLSDDEFASLFALTCCIPGPSSTQLAVSLGTLQGGLRGGLVAFACFSVTATSAMTILGCIFHSTQGTSLGDTVDHFLRAINMGLGAAAVALVFKAALMLSTKLAAEPLTRGLNVFAAAIALLLPATIWVLPVVLCTAGIVSAFQSRFCHLRSRCVPGQLANLSQSSHNAYSSERLVCLLL